MIILEAVYKTAIWKHFDSLASTQQEKSVNDLLKHAAPLLDHIIETFPTYTLHNGQHQINILNRFADLLGKRMQELSVLEAAILILSAFYHDIGMVYKKEERQNLKEDNYFDDFLNANPSARLKLQDQPAIDEGLAEWYCRWAHAKRVWNYLQPIDDLVKWEDDHFREELARVCESHNEDINYIKSDHLDSNFLLDADLKFCAILLRLADILDFDNSRSPESVYSFLGLDNPQSQSARVSHKEWEKHLASKGFNFKEWSDEYPYPIYFVAKPKHPAVENDIRELLDIIDNELQNCREGLRHCSDRWRKFILPGEINCSQIRSQGYTAGQYKFNLDQKQILNLLMGENLYQNPQVFLRELLQNAIDTSRHREKHEKHVNKTDEFKAQPIELSDWYDEEGFRWIRIDDYGMGMTLDQIQKYFLRVGNSFYNSDEFKISKLDYTGNDKNFTAISKFGIGILSCFMIGDQLEVSTRSVHCDGDTNTPIRLSLQGIDNYYFLYTGADIPKKMPKEHKSEDGYRKEIGTSISVRIDPNFDNEELILNELLSEIVFSSSISVKFKSTFFGLEKTEALSQEVRIFKLPKKDKLEILKFLDDQDILDINPEIHRIPIRLKNDKISDISGILYLFIFRYNLKRKTKNAKKLNARISFRDLTYNPQLRLLKDGHNYDTLVRHIEVNQIFQNLDFIRNRTRTIHKRHSLITYNGIIINGFPDITEGPLSKCIELNSQASACVVNLNLKDSLRPEFDISRNNIISLPWKLYSRINYLIRSCLDESSYDFRAQFNYFNNTWKWKSNEISVQSEDFLMNDSEGWIKIILNKKNRKENQKQLNSYFEIDKPDSRIPKLRSLLILQTIRNHYSVQLKLVKKYNFSTYLSKILILSKPESTSQSSLPEHYYCQYCNFNGLMPERLNEQQYNIDHPFTQWLIKAYDEMQRRFPYYVKAIQDCRDIDRLNKLLDKLKKLLPKELRPDFVITEDDFKVDIDTLPEWTGDEDDLVVIEE